MFKRDVLLPHFVNLTTGGGSMFKWEQEMENKVLYYRPVWNKCYEPHHQHVWTHLSLAFYFPDGKLSLVVPEKRVTLQFVDYISPFNSKIIKTRDDASKEWSKFIFVSIV